MKLRLLLWCLLLASSGCKSTTFSQKPDGTIFVRDTRFMTTTTARITATINPTNGVMQISVQASSKGDTAFIEAAAAGAAKGAAQGMK